MNVTIRDAATLAELSPQDFSAYLRASGWRTGLVTDRSALYTTTYRDELVEVELPLSARFRDYAIRIGEVMRALHVVEERSELEILRDIRSTGVDTIRFGLRSRTATPDGRIGLEEGARVFPQTRDLLLAAACAAVEKRAVYGRRKPNAAMEYLQRIASSIRAARARNEPQERDGSYISPRYVDEIEKHRHISRSTYRPPTIGPRIGHILQTWPNSAENWPYRSEIATPITVILKDRLRAAFARLNRERLQRVH